MKPSLHARCLLIREHPFSYIAKRLDPPVSRQVVARVAKGDAPSARIERAIKHFLKFHRYP